ncbi:hypothetical protein C2845_PM07G29970 [Panicum miliaceum]|uniref:Reverse transcriptase domain-containing protein n=1 Tax=Panicum miliaceum TaxID=4540 RepID=A0A3L6SLF0_PANMI|nr:hypothetical protein C2845_PM07G29970 [Panicum miliaceum]
MDLRNRLTNFRWSMVVVYGPAQHEHSEDFLEELGEVCRLGSLPMLIGGDFSLIRRADEKSSDNCNQHLMNTFNSFIGNFQLREVPKAGSKYTWTNKQTKPVFVTLDRFFMSADWESRFPLCLAWGLTRVGSDHCSIVLDTGEQGVPRPNYFFFERQWLLKPDFQAMVAGKWLESCINRPETCYSITGWHGSLGFLRQFLKGWNLQQLGEQKKTRSMLLSQLDEIDKLAESRELSADIWEKRYKLEDELENIYQMEAIYWQQRGSDMWVLEGDANTQFLHQHANGRRRKNTIVSLELEGVEIRSQEDLIRHVTDFYKNLFGSTPSSSMRLSGSFWQGRHLISAADADALTKPFEEAEIKSVVDDMKSNSAPGPNGFGVQFFKSFWPQVKGDLLAMFEDLYNHNLDLKRLNYGVITLVPKVKEANNIEQYRPICLLNVDFKIFTKAMNNRFTPLAREVIGGGGGGGDQTGFVKGRNILEGVLILHEVVHELKTSKKKGLIMKIDFEKAYDKMSWEFLEEVMRGKGLPEKWIRWVMESVQGGRVCVNVNGHRGPFFRTYQGLRQGDPLSPILFNLVADALSALLDKAVAKKHIVGVLDYLIQGGISHIQYADDTVIMIDGSDQSILNLKLILYCFEWLSGLKINFHKSEVFVFGADQNEKERMANMLNCKLGTFPMKYLGIPISENRLGSLAFSGLKEKMGRRLDPWKGKFLSSGGKLILTNSCLSSSRSTRWVSTSYRKVPMERWIRLGANYSGKVPKKPLNTTWQSGKR